VSEPWLPWLAGLLGLSLGSFLNVCTLRWPLEQSVVHPRSRCPRCEAPIAWYDNLPVVSWLVLRGRCRHCATEISLQYPLVELAAALIWAGAFWLHGPSWESLRAAAFLSILLGIALSDARFYIIPDQFSLGGAVLGVTLAFAPGGLDWSDALLGAVGGYVAFWLVGVGGTWVVRKLNPERLETAFEEHDEKRADEQVRARVARLRGRGASLAMVALAGAAAALAWRAGGTGALLVTAPAVLAAVAVLLAWAEAFEDPVFAPVAEDEAPAAADEEPASALGGGDVRMMALVGAFLGISGVLLTVLGGSVLALVAAIPLTLAFRQLIPLGIFLAFAAAGTYLFGEQLVAAYLSYVGL
jgi:prepilin signal peptidase PulO-like enzyme (type II secretory pathway)